MRVPPSKNTETALEEGIERGITEHRERAQVAPSRENSESTGKRYHSELGENSNISARKHSEREFRKRVPRGRTQSAITRVNIRDHIREDTCEKE